MDWALTGPSDVTFESKTDANAGTTAASGFGDPAPCLVNKVEVADQAAGHASYQWERNDRSRMEACKHRRSQDPPNAVVGESGLSRHEGGSPRGVLGEGSGMVANTVRGKAVATRQCRPEGDASASWNERTEG